MALKRTFLKFTIVLLISVILFYNKRESTISNDCGLYGCIDEYLDFEEFDNINGANKSIIPNIVHLIYLNETDIKFYQLICIFSIYFNHKPNQIIIHCDNCSFHGKYWKWIQKTTPLWKIIKLHPIPYRRSIFGKMVDSNWLNYHRSDVWRVQVLMNYGGIYLDNDVYVIQSLQKYLKFEMTIEWNRKNEGTGSQVMIAHRNARLLRAHFDSYRYL